MVKTKGPKKVGNDIYGVKSDWELDFKTGKTAGSEIRHSGYFHKYFYGYTEIRVPKKNGGYKIKRFYTEPWIIQDVVPILYIFSRFMYAGVVAAICFGYYSLMSADGYAGTMSVLVAVPTFLSVISLILLFAAMLNYVFMRKKMTWYDHRSSSGNLKKASLLAACCMGTTALMVIVNMILGADPVLKELKLAGCLAVCALAALALYFVEREMPYREEENDTILPEGEAHEIR